MAASAAFTVNGVANPNTHTTTYGGTVALALSSVSGVNSVSWEIQSTSHEGDPKPTITPAGSPLGATAAFTFRSDPSSTEGRGVLVVCTVTDARGNVARSSAVVGVANDNGFVPLCPGETGERSTTHGWTPVFNTAMAVSPGSGSGSGTGSITADVVLTSNDSLSGLATRDGITPVAGTTRAHAVGQSTAAQNGLWVAQAGAWTRPADFDSDADVVAGQQVFVTSGTLGAQSRWELTSGSTIAGSKTYRRVDISGDASVTITNGVARAATFVDWRDAPYSAAAHQPASITATAVAGSRDYTFSGVSTYKVGHGLVVLGAGHAHGLATPAAPGVAAQGTLGSTQWEFVVVAQTRDFGCSIASAVTSITDANATLSATNYISIHMPWDYTSGIHRYLIYGRRGGTGSYTFRGAVLANATPNSTAVYMPVYRLETNTAQALPIGVPSTPPVAPFANFVRGKITAIAGNVVTLDVAAGTSGSGLTVRACNVLAMQAAIRSADGGAFLRSNPAPEIRIGQGVFPFFGNVRLDRPVQLSGSGAGRSLNAPTIFEFQDGFGLAVDFQRTADHWCPGAIHRVGDRIMPVEHMGPSSRIFECTTAGYTGTSQPAWNTSNGATTADNAGGGTVVWTCRTSAPTGEHSRISGIRFNSPSVGLPAEWIAFGKWHAHQDYGGYGTLWTANTVVATGADYRLPSVRNGARYIATVGGTTHATTEPVWPLRIGATVVDGTVTWTCEDVSNAVHGSFITCYTRAEFDNFSVGNCSGSVMSWIGRNVSGPLGGITTNCNNWQVSNFNIQSSAIPGHGIVAHGSDANTGSCKGGGITLVNGTGLLDGSFLGNHWDCIYLTGCKAYAFFNTDDTQYGCRWGSGIYVEAGQVIRPGSAALWSRGTVGGTIAAESAETSYFSAGEFTNSWRFRRSGTPFGSHVEMSPPTNDHFMWFRTDAAVSGSADQILVKVVAGSHSLHWHHDSDANDLLCQMLFAGHEGYGLGIRRSIYIHRATGTKRRFTYAPSSDAWYGVPGEVLLDQDGTSQLGWSFNSACGGNAPAFATSTAYRPGSVVTDGTYAFAATRNGTSGGTAPSWPTSLGATVTSGGVLFVNVGLHNADRQAIAHPSPAPGADLTDANVTIHITGGQLRILPAGTLTTNRAVTLGTTGAEKGQRIRVVRLDTGPHVLSVDGHSLRGVSWVEFQRTASAWVRVGHGEAEQAEVLRGPFLGDASVSIAVTSGNRFIMPAGTQTANRVITLLATGATLNEIVTIERHGTEAFTLEIRNHDAASLYTFPVSASRASDFQFDGTNWLPGAHVAIRA